MKSSISYSLLLAAAACGVAVGQTTAYTTPVGYVTETLAPERFNLVGLTLQSPSVSTGLVASATSNSVTVTGATYSSLLVAGQTYILELADGTIQEVTAWTDTTLTTPDNISSKITAGTTAFNLRKAATVSGVFGATNSAGLTPTPDGDLTNTDTILILNSFGSFDTVFYVNDGQGTEGWYDDAFNPAADKPISYADAFFVRRAAGGSNINLVVSGEVKKSKTSTVINNGFNYIGAVAPAGLTFANSGLENFLTPSPDGDYTVVDNVLIPQADGSYKTVFYVNDGAGTTGWYDDAFGDASGVALTSGFLIQNVGSTKSLDIAVPTSYSSL
jgi:hypothetical protein